MGNASVTSSKKTLKQGFWSHFGEICTYSWRSLLAHPWILTFLFLSNILFVFLFSFYQQPLNLKISYTLDLLSNSFQTIVQSVDSGNFIGAVKQSTLTDVLLNDQTLRALLNDLVLLLLLLATVAYVVYTFFQSTSVRTIGWMILDKKPYTLWSFIKLNFVWFVFYLVFRLIVFAVDLVVTFFSNGKQILPDSAILYTIVHVALFYLVFISYTFIDEKSSSWRAINTSVRAGLFSLKTMTYYVLNFLPFALYLIPVANTTIIAPTLNMLSPLGALGSGIQLVILFGFYVFFVANIFTITHEVAKSSAGARA